MPKADRVAAASRSCTDLRLEYETMCKCSLGRLNLSLPEVHVQVLEGGDVPAGRLPAVAVLQRDLSLQTLKRKCPERAAKAL